MVVPTTRPSRTPTRAVTRPAAVSRVTFVSGSRVATCAVSTSMVATAMAPCPHMWTTPAGRPVPSRPAPGRGRAGPRSPASPGIPRAGARGRHRRDAAPDATAEGALDEPVARPEGRVAGVGIRPPPLLGREAHPGATGD